MTTDTDWGRSFDDLWRQLGPETRTALLDVLPEDWSFAGKRVLDFGSGWGRTLGHFLREAHEAEFWGVDVDRVTIEQLQRELCPPFHARVCGVDPPLEFEDASFDLIWAISVFTHLSDNSLAWLLELHRVLKPGGLLIATYMGRWHAELFDDEPWDEDRVGMNVLRHDQGYDQGGPMVMMSDWWIPRTGVARSTSSASSRRSTTRAGPSSASAKSTLRSTTCASPPATRARSKPCGTTSVRSSASSTSPTEWSTSSRNGRLPSSTPCAADTSTR